MPMCLQVIAGQTSWAPDQINFPEYVWSQKKKKKKKTQKKKQVVGEEKETENVRKVCSR
jgi:hypothetical protein